MLETPEARAKLRRKLETWPDDRKSPVTINQGLELLDMVDRLEKEVNWIIEKLYNAKGCPTEMDGEYCQWDDAQNLPLKVMPIIPEFVCKNCWREAARKAVEQEK